MPSPQNFRIGDIRVKSSGRSTSWRSMFISARYPNRRKCVPYTFGAVQRRSGSGSGRTECRKTVGDCRPSLGELPAIVLGLGLC